MKPISGSSFIFPFEILMLLFGVLYILLVSGEAYAFSVKEISIVSYGHYSARTDSSVDIPYSTTGSLSLVTDINRIEQTQIIKADLGTKFGIQFKVEGSPSGVKVPVHVIVKHPPFMNPMTEEISCIDKWNIYPGLEDIVYTGWEFAHPWELVPGLWTIQISYQKELCKRKQFIVELAEPREVFLLQTGAFKDLDNAVGFQKRLRKQGLSAERIPYTDPVKGKLHLVYIAVTKSKDQAEKLKNDYQTKTNKEFYVHRVPSDILSKSSSTDQ